MRVVISQVSQSASSTTRTKKQTQSSDMTLCATVGGFSRHRLEHCSEVTAYVPLPHLQCLRSSQSNCGRRTENTTTESKIGKRARKYQGELEGERDGAWQEPWERSRPRPLIARLTQRGPPQRMEFPGQSHSRHKETGISC